MGCPAFGGGDHGCVGLTGKVWGSMRCRGTHPQGFGAAGGHLAAGRSGEFRWPCEARDSGVDSGPLAWGCPGEAESDP